MLLKEFIYFEKNNVEDDLRYESDKDTTIIHPGDLRKNSRLTLKMLNGIRKAAEAREQEQKEDIALVRKMYAAPPPDAAPA